MKGIRMKHISLRRRLVVSAALFGGATAMLATLLPGWGLLWFASIGFILVAGILAALEYAAELHTHENRPSRR